MSQVSIYDRSCFVCDKKLIKVTPAVPTFYRFPTDSELRSLWITALGLKENDNVSNLYVCSLHFPTVNYIGTKTKQIGGNLRLKPIAVPSSHFHQDTLKVDSNCTPSVSNILETIDLTKIVENINNDHFYTQETSESTSNEAFLSESNLIKEDTNLTNFQNDQISTEIHLKEEIKNEIEEIFTFENEPEEFTFNEDTLSALSGEESISNNQTESDNLDEKFGIDNLFFNKSKRRGFPRYINELTVDDFDTPLKAARCLNLVFQTVNKKKTTIRTLQRRTRRLKDQVDSLKELVKELRQENKALTVLYNQKNDTV